MPEEKVAKTKIKKKRWIQILSPELLRNELIGEIPVHESKSLIDRLITVNLMSLTRDIKKQNTSIKFIISNIKGDKAITEFYGYYLNPTSIKRFSRAQPQHKGCIWSFPESICHASIDITLKEPKTWMKVF